jgi:hypothetical protein
MIDARATDGVVERERRPRVDRGGQGDPDGDEPGGRDPPRKESSFLRAIAGLRAHESQRLPSRGPAP